MEVSNEIKEEIRKTQSDLKNAIRIHQAWVARLKDNQNNVSIKTKIKEAENEIISIGHVQKKVIDRLRQELELYQQKLKNRNKQINSDYDNKHIAQQLRDYQLQKRTRKKSVSLLKPSVLNELHISTDYSSLNGNKQLPNKFEENDHVTIFKSEDSSRYNSDLSISSKTESAAISKIDQSLSNKGKELLDDDSEFIRATENFSLKDPAVTTNSVQDRRANFTNALNKAKQSICPPAREPRKRSPSPKSGSSSPGHLEDGSSAGLEEAPSTPSPPPLPLPGEPLTQENFLRVLGLVTPKQRVMMEKKRSERKKRSTTSTNRNDYVYGNFDMQMKKRKLNFPYLQQNITPPTTRAQQRMKQRQQQMQQQQTRATSPPSHSSASPSPESPPLPSFSIPSGLTIIPVRSPEIMPCYFCNQNDSPSDMKQCRPCGIYYHWSCACGPISPSRVGPLPPPPCPQCGEVGRESRGLSMTVIASGYANKSSQATFQDKLAEKRLLQERNQQLRADLKKLEIRAETLKENIEEKNIIKKKLLTEQIKTQKNLQKLLEFVGQFKDDTFSVDKIGVKNDSFK